MATEQVNYLLNIKDGNFTKSIGKATSKLGALKGVMASIGPALGVAAVAAGFTKIISVSAKFEKSMSNVKALTGATGQEFQMLEDQAKQLGETTAFSASESAEAMGFLAMAGFETNEIMSALPDTLNLAAAGSVALGEAADFASNILSGYGFEADQLGAVNDVLVKTFTSTNTTLTSLAESFKDVGPIASGMGLKFSEMSAAVGLLGSSGIQGSKAGRSLKNAIANLASPTDKTKTILDGLGISVFDSAGKMNGLTDIIKQLETSGASTTDILEIFGKIAGPSMAALVSQGSGAMASLTAEIEGAGGIAGDIASTKLDNFSGRVTILLSALEGLAINIGSVLLPIMSALVTGLTNVITFVNENALVIGILSAGMVVWALVMNAAAIAMGIVSFATKIWTGAQWLLNIALTANPIGLVIIAITALVAAIAWAWQNSEDFRGALFGLWEGIKVIGENIYKMLIEPFLAIGDIWEGIKDMFSGKGTGKLIAGMKRMGSSILSFLLAPLMLVVETIDEIAGTNMAEAIKNVTGIQTATEGAGEAAAAGFQEGVDDFREGKKETAKKEEKKGIDTLTSSTLGGAAAAAAGTPIKGEVTGAEGTKMTNINISIENLVNDLQISTTTLNESLGEVRDKVVEVLLTAVNDANLIAN